MTTQICMFCSALSRSFIFTSRLLFWGPIQRCHPRLRHRRKFDFPRTMSMIPLYINWAVYWSGNHVFFEYAECIGPHFLYRVMYRETYARKVHKIHFNNAKQYSTMWNKPVVPAKKQMYSIMVCTHKNLCTISSKG